MADEKQVESASVGSGMENGKGYLAFVGTAFTIFVGAATIGNIQLTQIKENAARIEMQSAADRGRIEGEAKKEIGRLEAELDKNVAEIRLEVNKNEREFAQTLAEIAQINQKFVEVETQFRLGKIVTDKDMDHLRDRIIKTEMVTDERGPRLAVLEEKVRRAENGAASKEIKP